MYSIMVQYPAHTKYFQGSDYSISQDNYFLTINSSEDGLTMIYLPNTEAVTITKEDQ